MTTHVDSSQNIAAILDELRKSREAATSTDSGATATVATLNFVVFVDDCPHREWVLERALKVADKHPSRLILLDSCNAGKGADVSISARQSASGTILSERVDVAVGSLSHDAIRSLTQELTVHDIPTVLWWTGARLLQSRTFSGLAELASSVLVDSSGKARDEETVRELGEFLSRYPKAALHDLAFMRLAPWQDMIAQFFDDPALREDLFSIEALEIHSGSEAEALYLAGWLGSRLSWEPLDRERFEARDGRKIPFAQVAQGDKRRVHSVTLKSEDSLYRARLCDDDENVVMLSVEGAKAKPAWLVPLQNIGNTSLIERAILAHARDQIFETSLETVYALIR